MENIDFDKIEADYKKSILNESKQKRGKRRREPIDERKITIVSMLISIIIIFIFLLFIINGGKQSGISMNNNLLDEVVYTNIKFENNKKENQIKNEKIKNEKNNLRLDESKNSKNIVQSNSENNVVDQKANIQVMKKYYVIQILASKNLKAVEKEIDKLKKSGYEAFYIKDGKSKYSYKLLIGNKFKTRAEAEEFGNDLKKKKIIKNFFTRFRED
ncbi:SPOR domain-containing protein [Haliovirga abyssi]|uniref:SPOR domain-containing protein n=1 Tax=Haliovirga abyssi TaxID=2996794 RepID=A0AAU9E2A8_9FUSO|nr:SPOR domain-containing protein [Haliovirga abyssi]BDU50535.1 hypothetical protein HLVA_11040 [Haliovirga abyssi]